MNEWMNGIWIRAPTGPMHLGLKTGPLCPIFWTGLYEPRFFTEEPEGPCAQFPNIFRVQKEGPQLC
jgi:hypothetical protein